MPALSARYAATRFRVLDLVCIAYALFIAFGLAFFHATVPDWPTRLAWHLAAVLAILELVRYAEPRMQRSAPWRFARTLYPLVLLLLAWGQMNATVSMFYAGSFWATDLVVRGDVLLFGGYPTVIVQSWHRPWLDELMAVFYFSYYLFLSVPLVLLVQRKNERALAAASVVALTYATTFAFFYLLPTKSPAHVVTEYAGMHASDYGGYATAALVRSLQNTEGVVGAAFPSSHVAGAFACALLAQRYAPAFGKLLVPLSLGVAVSTVWLGYHHALDPIVGLLWGWLCYELGLRWLAVRGEVPRST